VRELGDLVGEHRAAAARLPVLREPEVVEDQLRPAREQVQEPGATGRPFELEAGLERHHRLPPALRGERVALPRRGLLLFDQRGVRVTPTLLVDDLWQSHAGTDSGGR
jgi:hypothetical protein